MSASLTTDTREFQSALRVYYATTQKTLPQVLNQRAYNIAGRTMDLLKPEPGGEQAQRSKIRAYLNQQVSTRIQRINTGKNKGRFRRKGSRANQAAVVNLIIQKRRSRIGLKGLYGQAMRVAEGKFKQSAQVGVAFLKSPFVAIVRDLGAYLPPGPRMRIKTQWGRISVWPGSKGRGTVNPAKPGWSPVVLMNMLWNVKGAPTKADSLVRPNLQKAFNDEAAEMERHVLEKLQGDADKINVHHR